MSNYNSLVNSKLNFGIECGDEDNKYNWVLENPENYGLVYLRSKEFNDIKVVILDVHIFSLKNKAIVGDIILVPLLAKHQNIVNQVREEFNKEFNLENKYTEFSKKVEDIINSMCLESDSDTPDFILAQFLSDCLKVWNKSTKQRSEWFGYPKTEADMQP